MNDIYVAGVGMTPFGRLPERSVYDMVGEAVTLALKDAGAEAADIGSAFYATLTNGLFRAAFGSGSRRGIPICGAACRAWRCRSRRA